MLDLLYRLYFVLNTKKYNMKILRKLNSLIRVFLRYTANIYAKVNYNLKIGSNISGINTIYQRQRKVILSLTTFPARIETIWITIESLLNQSYRPDGIILWLAKEQFSGYHDIPKKLLKQQSRGLEIRFCDDLKSHKKYYYTFKEYPNDIVITVDDDVIYPRDTINELIKLYEEFPDCICCNRGHVIQKDKNGKIDSYSNWISNPQGYDEPSKFLCPTGVSGVLYPPGSVNNEVFNKQSIRELCLNADDLWLKIMSLKNNTRVVKSTSFPGQLFTIVSSQKESLAQTNLNLNKNDEQLNAILKKYSSNLK